MALSILFSLLCLVLLIAAAYALYVIFKERRPVVWPILTEGYIIHGIANPDFHDSLVSVLTTLEMPFEEKPYLSAKAAAKGEKAPPLSRASEMSLPSEEATFRIGSNPALGLSWMWFGTGKSSAMKTVLSALGVHYRVEPVKTAQPVGAMLVLGIMAIKFLITISLLMSAQAEAEQKLAQYTERVCLKRMREFADRNHMDATGYIERNQDYLQTCEKEVRFKVLKGDDSTH